MTESFRYYQTEADNAIHLELLIHPKCLVKMFCGTGKSKLMRRCKIVQNKKLVVYVFPSLSLITQFYNDYLLEDAPHPPEDILCISSENGSTTDPDEIVRFVSRPSNCIICITYQSFKTLIDNLGNHRINVCVFDEAHHAVGETYQKLIFENDVCEKQIFFTATPKNANGIIMYDRERPETGMCGKLVYDYSYLRGVNEGYLNPFEIRIDMFTENTNKSVYESIARAVLSSGNGRVLTFHSDVNTERETSVRKFVNDREFKRVFSQLQKTEFPQIKKYKNKNVSMISLDASINGTKRRQILDEFDKTPDDHVFVISSCETIGEGIDTKHANMCVFVDPKSSYVKIIQNIGRIVRKQFGVEKPNSTILIPCWVDKTKYLECGGDREKCDEVIRQDMSADGNFNGILNVMSALKQEDEDLYEICLYYPDTFSPQEIRSNLEKHGFRIGEVVGDGGLMETMEHVLETELDYEEYEYCDTTEEMIMNIAEENDVCIEIHTNSLENPVERYNTECLSGEIVRLYKSSGEYDENDEEDVYCPVLEKTGRKRTTERVDGPKRDNRMRVNVHTNPDVKVLWNITGDFDITKEICSCVIDCEVVDNWYENFEATKKFIDENERRPSSTAKNENEKQRGEWVSHQLQNYKNTTCSMKIPEKYDLWTEFMKKYREYFKSNDEVWDEMFAELKQFIDKHKHRPTSSTNTQLNGWLGSQLTHYRKKDGGMKNEKRYNEWTKFIEEYNDYFKNVDDIWFNHLCELEQFINVHKHRPTPSTNKQLNGWLSDQLKAYTKCLLSETRKNKWKMFIDEYGKYIMSDEEKWDNTLTQLEEFINDNHRLPSQAAKVEKEDETEQEKNKREIEKQLSTWLKNQNYRVRQNRYDVWTAFLGKYEMYFINDNWSKTVIELKQYIKSNNKRPTQKSENNIERKLGYWLSDQLIDYKNNLLNASRHNEWTQFMNEYGKYVMSNEEVWNHNFNRLKEFICTNKKKPSSKLKTKFKTQIQNETEDHRIERECAIEETILGVWMANQNASYKKKELGMKNTDPDKYDLWTAFLEEYARYMTPNQTRETETVASTSTASTKAPRKKSMKLQTSTTQTIVPKETPEQTRQRAKTEISPLHQRYKTMTSQNLRNEFNTNPELWRQYHEIAEANEQSFPEAEIPRNRIIQQLDKLKHKRSKRVVDMGCGKAYISKHFANDSRFVFKNYDHISIDESVVSCDISTTPEEDDSVEICILSLAMWGSNCEDYIKEAHSILEINGQLYIIETTKRWSEKDDAGNILLGKEGSRMKALLEENGFVIKDQTIEKFCMFVCNKK